VSIQLLNIVLYSHDRRRRAVNVKPGAVAVITGASKTGKSALIDIVDYCLGSGECRVPEGPIRRSVSWFGLRLQLIQGQAFIARRCPGRRAVSSEDCFVEVGDVVEIPDYSSLRQTTNTQGLGSLVSGWCGILDNLHEPPPGQTRPPLAANVRHALAFCFQPQDEIIRRQQLFHGAGDTFFAQALKDTLPYFLGAVDDDYVRKRERLRLIRERLRSCERKLAEIAALRGDGTSKADTLLAQARDVGLSDVVADSWEATVAALQAVASTPLANLEIAVPDQTEFARLSDERARLLAEHRHLSDEIAAVRAFESDGVGFSREATEQRARLKSIGLFEGAPAAQSCPLCSQALDTAEAAPGIDQVKETLVALSSRLDSASRATPQIERAVGELETRLQGLRQRIATNRANLEAIRTSDERFAQARDEATRRVHIVGRISLYLESLPDLPDTRELEREAEDLRAQARSLEAELGDDRVRERLDSITSILAERMTRWARDLGLEHSRFPLRLDLKNLTIVADTADGPVPMGRMGSGENWVGYHLIAHLALHQWFAARSRPMPHFLFLDQPSQIYFPSETDTDGSLEAVSDDDRVALSRMFRLVFAAVQEVAPGFQVIMTEHADLNEDWYQAAVSERWRGGLKLVPEDWPRQQ
jgi:hypothetical protein